LARVVGLDADLARGLGSVAEARHVRVGEGFVSLI
jgi:hypothetical protein